MIEKCFYKDRPAIKMIAPKLTAVFLPEDGGKIASLTETEGGREFLEQAKGERYQRLAYDGDFVESECSAWDDMFPTIDPCVIKSGKYKGITLPDHGEVCRLPWICREEDGKLNMSVKSRLFDIDYEKTVSVANDGGIDIFYRIENKSKEAFPCLWAGHCMLKGDDTARVITSYGEDDEKEEAFGPAGKTLSELPIDRLSGYKPKDGYAYKYYYTKPMKSGVSGLKFSDGKRLLFGIDEKKVKYIGVWINNGEFKNMYNIALEWCTAPFDSPENAEKRGYAAELKKDEILEFAMHISLKEGENE